MTAGAFSADDDANDLVAIARRQPTRRRSGGHKLVTPREHHKSFENHYFTGSPACLGRRVAGSIQSPRPLSGSIGHIDRRIFDLGACCASAPTNTRESAWSEKLTGSSAGVTAQTPFHASMRPRQPS
jgi:hypothetical protein